MSVPLANTISKPLLGNMFDPVFVLAAVLDWAGIAHNERGYLTLTADYRSMLSR